MDMIWMQHPLLPEDQLIYQPVEAQIGLQQCGWQVTDPPEPMLLTSNSADSTENPEEIPVEESEPSPADPSTRGRAARISSDGKE